MSKHQFGKNQQLSFDLVSLLQVNEGPVMQWNTSATDQVSPGVTISGSRSSSVAVMCLECQLLLGGGFNHLLFSSPFGEMIQFD